MKTCLFCGEERPDESFSEEHIWPGALGGGYLPHAVWRTNEVCQTCNNLSGLFVDASFTCDPSDRMLWLIFGSALSSFDGELFHFCCLCTNIRQKVLLVATHSPINGASAAGHVLGLARLQYNAAAAALTSELVDPIDNDAPTAIIDESSRIPGEVDAAVSGCR